MKKENDDDQGCIYLPNHQKGFAGIDGEVC